MKNLLLILSFLLALCVSVAAQDISDSSEINPAEIKQTTKFDEFGDISEKEFAPKLSKFYWLLRNNYNLRGYIIIYSNLNSSPFKQTSHFTDGKERVYQKYLNCGCIESVTIIRGGLREKMTTELWIVPPNGKQPEISSSGELIKDARYKLELLGTNELNLEEAKIKEEINELEETESEEENSEKVKQETETKSEDFAKELTEVLSRDKTWRAVLIFYADKDEYDIEKSRQIIEIALQPFVKNSGLDLNRVKLIFGGYRAYPQIETWIVNKNGIEPEPMPDEKFEAEN